MNSQAAMSAVAVAYVNAFDEREHGFPAALTFSLEFPNMNSPGPIFSMSTSQRDSPSA